MNNHNFLLFTFSLMALSCSAMEINTEKSEAINTQQLRISKFIQKIELISYNKHRLLCKEEQAHKKEILDVLQKSHPDNESIMPSYNSAIVASMQADQSADTKLAILNEFFPVTNAFNEKMSQYITNTSATLRNKLLCNPQLNNFTQHRINSDIKLLEKDKKIIFEAQKQNSFPQPTEQTMSTLINNPDLMEELSQITEHIETSNYSNNRGGFSSLWFDITTLNTLLANLNTLLAKEKNNDRYYSLLNKAITIVIQQNLIPAQDKLDFINKLYLPQNSIIHTNACDTIRSKSAHSRALLVSLIRDTNNTIEIDLEKNLEILTEDKEIIKNTVKEHNQKVEKQVRTVKIIGGGLTLAAILALILYNYDKLPSLADLLNNTSNYIPRFTR